MIEINAPDGSVVRFPPDTSDDTIRRVMAQAYPSSVPRPAHVAPSPGVGQFAQPMIAPEARGVTRLGDATRSLGAGVVKGGIGLATLPGNLETLARMGINYAGRKMGADDSVVDPQSFMLDYRTAKKGLEHLTGPLYEPQTTAGEYARTIGEFAPNLVFPGSMVQRGVGNVLAPAVASETAGQVTKGTDAEPWARIGGGLAGSAIVNAGTRLVTPINTAAGRGQHVAVLEHEGIHDLTAGQRTGNMPLRWAESAAMDVPGSGTRGAEMMTRQAEQFTRAALRRAGIDAPRATPDVINDAFARIGGNFDRMAQQSTLRFTPQLYRQVRGIATEYNRFVPEGLRSPIVREVADEISTMAQRGQWFLGDRYQAWRSTLDRAARGADNPYLRDAIRDVRTALDDAVERALIPALRGEWGRTRREYRNMLVLEKAATAPGVAAADGLISPQALRAAAVGQHRRSYARGQGDFAELARSGAAIMDKLPQSGTTPRAIASNIGKVVLGSAAGGAAIGGPEGAMGGAIAPYIVQALLSRGIMSGYGQRYLGNAVIPQRPVETRQSALPALVPFARGKRDDRGQHERGSDR